MGRNFRENFQRIKLNFLKEKKKEKE